MNIATAIVAIAFLVYVILCVAAVTCALIGAFRRGDR